MSDSCRQKVTLIATRLRQVALDASTPFAMRSANEQNINELNDAFRRQARIRHELAYNLLNKSRGQPTSNDYATRKKTEP